MFSRGVPWLVYAQIGAAVLFVVLFPRSAPAEGITVCFTPPSGCAHTVVRVIGEARRSIRVQAYQLTSDKIARALMDAARRGVNVVVLLDKSNRTNRYSAGEFFSRMRIPVKIDTRHAIAHNKVMVIDDAIVITGSFNFTKAADERNAENLIIIHDVTVAARYLKNWAAHEEHSEEYIASTEK